jgi:Na+-translocating ferredoxin:NAD+ oxidoreductase subunit B
MNTDEKAYVLLQRHLDRQAIGFPATRSGAEIRVLKHIFTPAEAAVAACLSYRPEPLEVIFTRAAHLACTPEALAEILDRIEAKGGIELKIVQGRRLYCNVPLVVGMYEFQLDALTPEFIKDFDDYIADWRFGLDFLSTKLPQMRTIPIAKSIRPQHHVSTFDEVAALLQQAEAPFAVFECICRKKREIKGAPCRVTRRKETCFATGGLAQAVLRREIGREITLPESLALLAENQKEGLVLQPSNTQKAEFICSCCGCCCGMLGMQKSLPRPVDFWATNFYAAADPEVCTGCGTCEKRCQVEALRVSKTTRKARVDRNRCIGCGLCVPTCPENALTLENKTDEIRPPASREELHAIMMAHKKGRLGKLKLAGKLASDAIRVVRIRLPE